MKSKISITINDNILKEVDKTIDNLLIRNRSQAIEQLISDSLDQDRTAVILSGGSEKDLKISSSEYRITARLKDKALVEEAVKKLRSNNFKTIYIIACKKILTEVFSIIGEGSGYGVKINYIEDRLPKGSASSLKQLKGRINSNFLVVYGDILFKKINIEELWNDHLRQGSVTTLMLTSSPTPSKKGIVKMEGTKILSFIQKPQKSDTYVGFSSMFVSSPEILEYSGSSLEKNIFPALAKKGLLSGHISSEKEIHIHSKADAKKAAIQKKTLDL